MGLRAGMRYPLYSDEGRTDGFGAGLPERYDLASRVLAGGGDYTWKRATRLNIFRTTLATAAAASSPLWAWFRDHPALPSVWSGEGLLEPVIVYANAMVPGQELAVHDDVPSFRGLDRHHGPQWLLVVMRRSGLFARWHIPTVHVISWWSSAPGGDFLVAGDRLPSCPNHAIVGDFEVLPHGVARLEGVEPPQLVPGGALQRVGSGWQALSPKGEALASYGDEVVRLSLSWRARVLRDEADRARLRDGSDDLSLDQALDGLTDELRSRGALPRRAPRPRPRAFAKLLLAEWPAPGGAAF